MERGEVSSLPVRLGDVLIRERRPIAVDPDATYEEVGIRSFGKGFFHKPPLTGADLGTKRIFEIHKGDLVLNIVFAWEGAVALAGTAEHGKSGSHRFPTYVADPERADPRYLLYFLSSEKGRELLTQASPGSAGRNRTLNQESFQDIRLTLPPLEEQRRIAATVERVAERVAQVQEARAHARKLGEAITAATFHALSRSAPEVPLGELLAIAHDEVAVEPDETYRPAGIYSFGRGLFARPSISGAETKYAKFTRLREGQLVLSRLNGWEGALDVVGPDFHGLVVSQEYPTFDIDPSVLDPRYMRWVCRWPDFWDALVPRGSMVRRKRVHPERLLSTTIPLPSLEEQRGLAEAGVRLEDVKNRGESADRLLEALIPSTIGAALHSGLPVAIRRNARPAPAGRYDDVIEEAQPDGA
jgi:type I restriction enzyme, S subunit